MSTTINTAKVAGRRDLHFTCLDDIRADVEQLAKCKELRSLGNWTPAQIIKHLAITMNGSIDGIPRMIPGFVRFLLRLFMMRRLLTKPMSPGFQLPKKAAAAIPPPDTTLEDGLQSLRHALERLQDESERGDNPVVGPMTREEWDQLHCRHAELHLSFLVAGA